MRKFLFFLFITGVINSFAQTKSLVGVSLVKPKMGQESAFEAAWKAHLKKFHQADTSNRRGVFEITSGVRDGGYYLTSSGMSWADLDVERSNNKAHDMDYATTITSTLASGGGNEIYRWADTLSYRPEVKATKFLLTSYHIKTGKQSDVTDEIKRAIAVNKKINSPLSYDGYIQQLAGTRPVVVIIRHLKDGFKELDSDYYKDLNDKFKAAYVEMYGQPAWDKRMTAIADVADLVEVEMMKYRADLSSVR
jgi:hypothetical protein